MSPRKFAGVALTLCALGISAAAQTRTGGSLTIASVRHAADDLEVTGMIAGLPNGAIGYVSYADLSKLPQITATIQNDANFADQPAKGVRVSGIPLDQLAKILGALPTSDLIDALCADRYRSHYPSEYTAAHHPLVALKINGERPAAWAAKTKAYDPGPYFITHANYVPRYEVLSHPEEAQIPDNLIRLNFTTAAATYGPIAPRGNFPSDSAVAQGFTIAKQNCLRCHFLNGVGGTKSGLDWRTLSTWAQEQPKYFQQYVKNPQSVDPHAHMEGNPTYDAATLEALTVYFRAFTAPAGSTNKENLHK